MASAVAVDFFRSKFKFEMWDHDPGATTAQVVTPDGGTTKRVVNMGAALNFAVMAMTTVPGGGALTLLEIIASASEDMSSPEVIKETAAIVADASGDWAFLECDREEIAQAASTSGKALKYAAGRLTMSNAAGEAAVLYFRLPVHAFKDLTPATAIA